MKKNVSTNKYTKDVKRLLETCFENAILNPNFRQYINELIALKSQLKEDGIIYIQLEDMLTLKKKIASKTSYLMDVRYEPYSSFISNVNSECRKETIENLRKIGQGQFKSNEIAVVIASKEDRGEKINPRYKYFISFVVCTTTDG